jgi:hypothetical protein
MAASPEASAVRCTLGGPEIAGTGLGVSFSCFDFAKGGLPIFFGDLVVILGGGRLFALDFLFFLGEAGDFNFGNSFENDPPILFLMEFDDAFDVLV